MRKIKSKSYTGTERHGVSDMIERVGGAGGGSIKTTARKARTAVQANLTPEEELDLLEIEKINKPYKDRMNLDSWGGGNLLLHPTRTMTYPNGEQKKMPIILYHGSPTFSGDEFKQSPYGKRDPGYFGSGEAHLTTNLDDAHLYANSKSENLEEITHTEIQQIKDKVGFYKPSVIAVYVAPKKPLYIGVFSHELGFIQQPKDYNNIIAATRRLIEKLPKDQRESTLQDFTRKVIESASDAENFFTGRGGMYNNGEVYVDNQDPYNVLPTQKARIPEETWRWRHKPPEKMGQLNIEELASFIPSGDFTEIAREAGYTASCVQFHENHPKVQEKFMTNPEEYHEVILYGKGQVKKVKNKGTFDKTNKLSTQRNITQRYSKVA